MSFNVQRLKRIRILVLVLSCLLLFGNYYAYDVPAALNQRLAVLLPGHRNSESGDYALDEDLFAYQLNLLYSIYSIPNIILPGIAGLLMDRFGLYRVVILLSTCVFLGQTIFSAALSWQWDFFWVVLGRMMFGFGGESLGVAQASFTSRWFLRDIEVLQSEGNGAENEELADQEPIMTTDHTIRKTRLRPGKYLALTMGLNLAIGRIGSVVNDFLSPIIGFQEDVSAERAASNALWVGTLFCVLSYTCALGLCYLDSIYLPKWIACDTEEGEELFFDGELSSSQIALQRLHRPTILDNPSRASQGYPSHAPILAGKNKALHSVKSGFIFIWRQLGMLPLAYWVSNLIMVLSYGTVVPFNTIHAGFLQKRFSMEPILSAQIMAIPDTISLIFTPLTGSIVDRLGYRVHVLMMCTAILAAVHLMLGLTWVTSWAIPYIPLILLGFAYSFLLLFNPLITLLCPDDAVSTAFGLSYSALNLSLTLFPMLVSFLMQKDGTYYDTEMLFVGCGLSACILCFWLSSLDRRRHDNVLLKPGNARIQHHAPVSSNHKQKLSDFNVERDQ